MGLKRLILVLLFAAGLAVFGCGGGGGGGDDGGVDEGVPTVAEVEPNDAKGQAQAVPAPSIVTGTVNDQADDVDIFTFTPPADGIYNVTLSGLGSQDLDLFLSTVDDSEVHESPIDAPDMGAIESITAELTGGIAYYVTVDAFDTTGEASYRLDISGDLVVVGTPVTETEPNDIELSGGQDVPFPATVTGTVNDGDDAFDVFRLPSGTSAVEVTLSAFGGSDLDLAVYNADLSQWFGSAVDAPASGAEENVTETLDANEEWFVEVLGFDTAGQDQGYTLTMTTPGGGGGDAVADAEPNGISFTGGEEVAVPASIEGTVNDTSDAYDVFTFVPAETATYAVVLSGFDRQDLDLIVYSADRSEEYFSFADVPFDPGNVEGTAAVLTAGVRYFVNVFAFDTAGGNAAYQLNISRY